MKGRKLVAKRVQGVQCTRALGCQGLTDTDKKMEQVNQTIVYWKLHIEFGFFRDLDVQTHKLNWPLLTLNKNIYFSKIVDEFTN